MPAKKSKKHPGRHQQRRTTSVTSGIKGLPDKTSPTEVLKERPKSPTSPNEFNCTGDLVHDFRTLCQLHGVDFEPPVVLRRHSRSERSLSRRLHRRISDKSFESRPSSQCGSVDYSSRLETDDRSSIPCTASVIAKDTVNYFKPRIQVEHTKGDRAVSEIYIEGWKVDNTMMDIVCQCCLFLVDLVHLQLWNVGLTAQTLQILASSMSRFPTLTSLTLDANPLREANTFALIDGDSKLEKLSLRFCQLNDINAYGIGSALGATKRWNKKLLTLNLSNNQITDVGARHLADGLKTNRTLLVLNLAGNGIGDDGAAALAEVLSYFLLNPEQVWERRQKISEKSQKLELNLPLKDCYSGRSTQKSVTIEKVRQKPSSLKDGKPTNGGSPRLKTSTGQTTKRKKEGRPVTPVRSRVHRRSVEMILPPPEVEDKPESKEEEHPLLEALVRKDGDKLWLLGNRSLLSLNLSRNVIGEKGIHLLCEMCQEQAVAWRGQRQTTQGLKRLVLHRNNVPADNKVLMKVQHFMSLRDPFKKIPILTLNKGSVSPCAMPPITI